MQILNFDEEACFAVVLVAMALKDKTTQMSQSPSLIYSLFLRPISFMYPICH